MTEDEKDYLEWRNTAFVLIDRELAIKQGFFAGRRTLREKIKSDPSIGKLEVEEKEELPWGIYGI